MFKFDFDLESIGDVNKNQGDSSQQATSSSKDSLDLLNGESTPEGSTHRCSEIKLEELIDSLPPFVSYSTIKINTTPNDLTKSIWRRDLYDAKYQTYVDPEAQSDSSTEDEDEEKMRFRTEFESNQNTKEKLKNTSKDPTRSNEHVQSLLNAPSDLVPGIYEGGFKTWESSLDLIQHFSKLNLNLSNHLQKFQERKPLKVLEIGCGTALPTVWLLFKLFYDLLRFENEKFEMGDQEREDEPSSDEPRIEVHLQDFNPEVLYLLTFPNIILAFHRASQLVSSHDSNDQIPAEEDQSGDIELTPDLRARFLDLLRRHRLQLRFFHGPWHSFLRESSSNDYLNQYDLTYSSETIYSPHTLSSLIDLFQRIRSSQLLVAAKTIYFGVGGSSFEFIEQVENRGGKVIIIWPTELDHPDTLGVGRLIMKVSWPTVHQ
ncbi:hypothetical protein DFH28DRAFT_1092416 [Melampsora americana]|nr:hypothetical protein DFH28DRAFT_1092416 [Melampsora americana]